VLKSRVVSSSSQTRARIVTIIGLLIGGAALWLALREVEFGELVAALRQARWIFLLPCLGLLALFYWLKALRWTLILKPVQRLSPLAVMPSMLVGFAANNLLPARMGELARAILLGRQTGLSKSTVLATIVFERILDVLSVSLLLGCALLLDPGSEELLLAAGYLLGAAGLVLLTVVVVAVHRPEMAASLAGTLLRLAPARVAGWVEARVRHMLAGLESIKRPRLLFGIVLASLGQWILIATCLYLTLLAARIEVGWTTAVVVLGLTVAGIALPSAPGFIGTIEFCFVLGLKPHGIGADEALAAGLLYHALNFGTVTLAGLVAFRRAHLHIEDLRD